MSSSPTLRAATAGKTLSLIALLLGLTACAQPQQSAERYDTTRENTQRDADTYARGATPQAQPQIQLGFGDDGLAGATPQAPQAPQAAEGAAEDRQAAAATPRPLAEARSFLGTVPCPSGMACDASRFVVTLAPSGEWRSRTTLLVDNQARQTLLDQGCWEIIGDSPLRIALTQSKQGGTLADLSFLNNNTLRVHAINNVQPLLEHRLTRQADLDPIDELQGRPALTCP